MFQLCLLSPEISFHSHWNSWLLKQRNWQKSSFSESLSKGNHTSPKGIKIRRSQFDPENWMITKESDYSHCNVYTRFWLDSCSHFFNYACINRTITHPIQYHLQFREDMSVKKKFLINETAFYKGSLKEWGVISTKQLNLTELQGSVRMT